MTEAFEQSSRRMRARLAPVVARVAARHRDVPIPLREPATAMGVWFTVSDADGTPLVLVCAHASSIGFLLGKRGFLHFRDTASIPQDRLLGWFEDVLDAALSGGLEQHDAGRATLHTRGGPIALAL